ERLGAVEKRLDEIVVLAFQPPHRVDVDRVLVCRLPGLLRPFRHADPIRLLPAKLEAALGDGHAANTSARRASRPGEIVAGVGAPGAVTIVTELDGLAQVKGQLAMPPALLVGVMV